MNREHFTQLWRYYLLSVIGDAFRKQRLRFNPAAKRVIRALEETNLLPAEREGELGILLKAVMVRLGPVEAKAEFGVVKPQRHKRAPSDLFVTNVFDDVQLALSRANLKMWLVIDRLDEAFESTIEVEKSALRGLFHVYYELKQFDRVKLKIFLRSDIWRRINRLDAHEVPNVSEPFPIMGKIDSIEIKWDKDQLLDLIMRRFLINEGLRTRYNVRPEISGNITQERDLFCRIFPDEVGQDTERSGTLDWMLEHTNDGAEKVAPRYLVYLLTRARDHQETAMYRGFEPPDQRLFDEKSIEDALPDISQVAFEKNLCADHPKLVAWLYALEGAKANQTDVTLAGIWEVDVIEARKRAAQLVDVGFFKKRETMEGANYWIPFLYRHALGIGVGKGRRSV